MPVPSHGDWSHSPTTLRRFASKLRLTHPMVWLTLSLGAAVCLCVYSLYDPAATKNARTRLIDNNAPFLEASASVLSSFREVGTFFGNFISIHRDNSRLRAENEQLKKWQGLAHRLQEENKILRKELNVVEPLSTQYLRARVITFPSEKFSHSILINAGRRDGVVGGQPVVISQGIVGRVTEVGDRSARVLLITDVNSRVPVQIESTRQQAILAGTANVFPQLNYFEKEANPRLGQRVVTSGKGGVFPPGLLVGTIAFIHSGSYLPEVRPAVPWHKLEYVQVLQATCDQMK